jgi:hypothetical protein
MALSIDGHAGATSTSGSGSTITAALTTANSGDIIVICVYTESFHTAGAYPNLTGVTVGGNAATLRNRFQWQGNSSWASPGPAYQNVEIWWYYASGTLASASVVATVNANWNDGGVMQVFAVKGFVGTAYQTNPWDQSAVTTAGFFAQQANTVASPNVSQIISASNISTANAASLIFSFGASVDFGFNFAGNYAPGAIAGTTATDVGSGALFINDNEPSTAAVEYRVLSSAVSSASAAFGGGSANTGSWGIATDALSTGVIVTTTIKMIGVSLTGVTLV